MGSENTHTSANCFNNRVCLTFLQAIHLDGGTHFSSAAPQNSPLHAACSILRQVETNYSLDELELRQMFSLCVYLRVCYVRGCVRYISSLIIMQNTEAEVCISNQNSALRLAAACKRLFSYSLLLLRSLAPSAFYFATYCLNQVLISASLFPPCLFLNKLREGS